MIFRVNNGYNHPLLQLWLANFIDRANIGNAR